MSARPRREGRIATKVGASVALALGLVASPAAASPQDILGQGVRVMALGGTGTASATGSEATWANPALLSLGRERQLTLGAMAVGSWVHARGGGMPGDIDTQGMRGAILGALLPLPLKAEMRDRVALGLSFFTPSDVVVRGRVLYPETPQYPLITDRLRSIALQAALGIDVSHGIRIGAGVSALAAISGSVIVATDASGSVGTKVDDQLVTRYAPLVGASYDFLDDYRVGVTYRGKLEARFAIRIEVNDLGSLTVPPLNIAGLAQYDPWQVQAEVARVRGPVRVAVGALFRRWSSYPGAPEPTILCPPDKPACLALGVTSPGFRDTVSPRAGVEIDVRDRPSAAVKVRAGYALEPTPAPEQTGASRLFDNTRHVLTAGAGVAIAQPVPLSLDLFGQAHLLASRDHATPSGTVHTGGVLLAGGAAATVSF